MTILRYVTALALIFFGGNKLAHLMDPPEMPEQAQAYWDILETVGVMTLVGIIELIAGLSLLIKKYQALMMIILMSISVNAVMYHVAFDMAGVGMGLVLLILNLLMIYDNKDKYKELLS